MTAILPLKNVPKRRRKFCDLVRILYTGFLTLIKFLLLFISLNLKFLNKNWYSLNQSEVFHYVSSNSILKDWSSAHAHFCSKKATSNRFCCAITYHRTLGFWEIISLSKASTKSLSYPVLSNLFVSGSVAAAGDLFYTNRGKKHELMMTSNTIFHFYESETKIDSSDIFIKLNVTSTSNKDRIKDC